MTTHLHSGGRHLRFALRTCFLRPITSLFFAVTATPHRALAGHRECGDQGSLAKTLWLRVRTGSPFEAHAKTHLSCGEGVGLFPYTMTRPGSALLPFLFWGTEKG